MNIINIVNYYKSYNKRSRAIEYYVKEAAKSLAKSRRRLGHS